MIVFLMKTHKIIWILRATMCYFRILIFWKMQVQVALFMEEINQVVYLDHLILIKKRQRYHQNLPKMLI